MPLAVSKQDKSAIIFKKPRKGQYFLITFAKTVETFFKNIVSLAQIFTKQIIKITFSSAFTKCSINFISDKQFKKGQMATLVNMCFESHKFKIK